MRRGGGRGRLDQHAIAARSKAPLWLVLWSTRVLEGMQCVRSGTAEYIREKQRRILRGTGELWSWRTPTRARPSFWSTRPTRRTTLEHGHSFPVPEVYVSVFLVCMRCRAQSCLQVPKPAGARRSTSNKGAFDRAAMACWSSRPLRRRRDAWYTSNTFTRRRPSATTPPAPPASTSHRCSGRSPGTAARSASRASRRRAAR